MPGPDADRDQSRSADRGVGYAGRFFTPDRAARYGEQADAHAHRAEDLLQSITAGNYGFTPIAVSVAAVHAQLALAYAKLADFD